MSYWELDNRKISKTRKAHGCEWCAEEIAKGSAAQHRVYIFEGDFQSAYMHPECAEAMGKTPQEEVMEGWIPGDYKRGQHVSRYGR